MPGPPGQDGSPGELVSSLYSIVRLMFSQGQSGMPGPPGQDGRPGEPVSS